MADLYTPYNQNATTVTGSGGTALQASPYTLSSNVSNLIPTTPTVVTSKAATTDLNNISKNLTSTVQGINTQKTNVQTAQSQADAQAAAKTKADQDAAVAKAKVAALSNPQAPTAPSPVTYGTDDSGNLVDDNGTVVSNGFSNLPYGVYSKQDPATGKMSYVDSQGNAIGGPKSSTQSANDISNQAYQQAQNTFNQITGIQNGSIPLSAGEQAQVDDLKRQFNNLIEQTKTANTNYQQGLEILGAESGRERYTPQTHLSQVNDAIQKGIQKVADLNTQMSAAVAKMEQGFKDGDIASIKSANDVYQNAAKDRVDFLNKMTADAAAAVKDQRDFAYKQQQDSIKNAMDSAQFDYKKTQDAIDNAFKKGQLTETQRHNLATEALERAKLTEPTATEKKAAADALKEAKSSIPIMQDKLKLIDTLKAMPGLATDVGPNFLSRAPTDFVGAAAKVGSIIGIPTSLTDLGSSMRGERQAFAGGIHQLTNGLTLQNLIDAKARGATFGALSEGELSLLASSASQLNDWEIKDKNGKGLGVWNIDEGSFTKELDNIKNLTQRALLLSQGSLLDDSEASQLDRLYQQQQAQTQSSLDPSNYYQ